MKWERERLFLFFFRKVVNVSIGLADSLSSSVLCPDGLEYFLKCRAPGSLEEAGLEAEKQCADPRKATAILLSPYGLSVAPTVGPAWIYLLRRTPDILFALVKVCSLDSGGLRTGNM